MTSTKRKPELTTDDLLRRQEEAGNKRVRISNTTAYTRDEDVSGDSSADEDASEVEEAANQFEASPDDDESSDSDDSVAHVSTSVVHDRFGQSDFLQEKN